MAFTFDSPVFFDEMDAVGHLYHVNYVTHVDRAHSALFEHFGYAWERFEDRHPDVHYVVRELHIEYLASVTGPRLMPVTLWGERLGTSSAVYGFECGTDPVVARGHRAIVKVDPQTGRPAPWTDDYRRKFTSLTR